MGGGFSPSSLSAVAAAPRFRLVIPAAVVPGAAAPPEASASSGGKAGGASTATTAASCSWGSFFKFVLMMDDAVRGDRGNVFL